jgi:hypothetical protein
MKGTKFPRATFDLIKPDNMTGEQCNSLPATRGIDANGFNYILTAFKPSEDDIEAIKRGELVYLKVLGTVFSPVALFTLDEEGNCNPE